MKTRWSYTLAGLMVFLLCLSVCTNTTSAAEVWSDNFDDGNYDGWTILGYENWTSSTLIEGNFSAATGMLTVLDDDINVARHDSTTNVGTWTFDIFVPDDSVGNIDFIFMSNGTRPFPHFSSMMISWEAWLDMDRWDLWELRGNQEGLLLEAYTPPGGIQGWHHVEVSRTSSGRFLVYLNGTLRSNLVSNDVTSSTYLEFWCWNATGAMIDNIVVDDTPLPIPSTSPPPSTTPTTTPTPLPRDLIAIVGGVAVVVIVLVIVVLRRR